MSAGRQAAASLRFGLRLRGDSPARRPCL